MSLSAKGGGMGGGGVELYAEERGECVCEVCFSHTIIVFLNLISKYMTSTSD